MITPITYSDRQAWEKIDDPWFTDEQLANKMNEIIERINGEPERLEEMIDVAVARKLTQVKADPNCKLCFGTGITGNYGGRLGNLCDCINNPDIDEQIEKNRRSPDPDCTTCNGTGVIDDPENERSYPCYCYKRKDEPDIDEQILKNTWKMEIAPLARNPNSPSPRGKRLRELCDHPDCLICNECDEPIDDDRSEMFEKFPPIVMEKAEKIDLTEEYKRRGLKPAGDVCKAHLVSDIKVAENGDKFRTSTADFTDAAFEGFDSRAYNIKLWTRDMRKMIKGKNISPKLKDDIRRKLNELEEI